MNVAAIIPAAGKGRRFGAKISKLFAKVGGKPVFFYTLKNLSSAYPFKQILVVSVPAYFKKIESMARPLKIASLRLVKGGSTRAESVKNALLQVPENVDWVLVHDAARPLVSREIIRRAMETARKKGAAISAIPATATVKRVNAKGIIVNTEDRRQLYLAQTPQVFSRKKLLERYKKLGRKALNLTDEAAFFDKTAVPVHIAPGSVSNFKITTPEDLEMFRFYLKKQPKKRG